MADLDAATTVTRADGARPADGSAPHRLRATLDPSWEIWGPMGGYMASVALRAVGAVSVHPRPASFAAHFLGVARFAPVDLVVTPLREGRAAASYRVEMTQDERRVLEATVWTTRPDEHRLDHEDAVAPDVAGPDGLADIADLVEDGPPFPFWQHFDARPLDWTPGWPPAGPLPPVWREWLRFRPEATFPDPWVDACRALVLVDLQSWPSAHRPHAWRELPIYGPSLDLAVAFHRFVPDDEWLLADGHAPVGADSLVGWHGRLWSSDRRLVASGGGQVLCRPMR